MPFIKITKECLGVEKDRYNMPISTFSFYEGEVFEVVGTYNYYDGDNEFWNTEQPTIIITFDDSALTVHYDIPPEHYEYIALEDNAMVTTFVDYDLVERNESIMDQTIAKEKAVDFIMEQYLAISRFDEYLWRIIYE
jgi:hypothetical protein